MPADPENQHKLKTAIDHFKKGLDVLSSGPASYYIEQVIGAHDALLTKYAPFPVGSRVVLRQTVDTSDKPGWRGYKHLLVAGATGSVESVEFNATMGELVFCVVLDAKEGIMFRLREDELRLCDQTTVDPDDDDPIFGEARIASSHRYILARLFPGEIEHADVGESAPGWRPIETAPKDGGSILVYNNNPIPDEPRYKPARCWSQHTAVVEWGELEETWVHYMPIGLHPELHFTPTHWMPLPPPPEAR